jgi:hypothetical protein
LLLLLLQKRTHHYGLEALADLAFTLLGFVNLFSQLLCLVAVAAHLGLGLLATHHGAFEGGVRCLALESLGLHGERVELIDLVVHRAVARVQAIDEILLVGATHRGEEGVALLVVGEGLQWCSAAVTIRRAGRTRVVHSRRSFAA